MTLGASIKPDEAGVTGPVTATAPAGSAPAAPRPTAGTRLAAGVGAIPQHLLLALLWFSYVAAAAYVVGVFRPVVVFPATFAVLAVAWWRHRRAMPRSTTAPAHPWVPAVGALAGLAVAGGWFLLNLPYLSERVQVNRDPDIYTLTALWLLDHPSPSIPVPDISSGTLGFGLSGDALGPQGNHLVAGVSAAVGWIFGQEAVFWGNLACGAAALLGLYVLGSRIVGSLWALVPVLALAASLPMLEFSRALYSEPLAMTFTFLGAGLLWTAWERDRTGGYVLAGMAFGGVSLARVDGTLPLVGVLVGLTAAAFFHADREGSRRRWAAPLVLLGSLPGIALGFLDVLIHSGSYVQDLRSQLVLLGGCLVVASVIALGGALVAVAPARSAAVRRWLARAAVGAAVVSAAVFVVLATRQWWYVGRQGKDNGLVSGIQMSEGLPVDGTRTYAELTVAWISWYHGWPLVLVALGGLVAWLVIGTRRGSSQLFWLSSLFLPSALLYLTAPAITPDQIWAMRRFLPVVIPGLLLAGVWVARRVVDRARTGTGLAREGGVLLAAAFTVATVAWPVVSSEPLRDDKNLAGALEGNEQVCEQIDGRPTIVTGIDTYLPTVIILCDVTAASIPEPTPRLLAEAHAELGGGEVVLVTRGPGAVPWVGDPPAQLTWTQQVWERSLTGPPDDALEQVIGVSLGLVNPDGSVQPLNP